MNIKNLIALTRLNKPIGILLTLWPALWALWISAAGTPPIKLIVIFILGAVCARSAGCVINDYIDRDIDQHIKRTRARPLAVRQVSEKQVLLVFFLLGLCSLALTLCINAMTFWLAIAAALLAMLYPFMKRITYFPQLILGIVFNSGILMAFTAIQQHIPFTAWILWLATIAWTMAYDSMYAMVDRDDDIKLNLKSTAILFGQHDRLIIGGCQGLFLILLLLVGWQLHYTLAFYSAWVVSVGISIYQQYLLRHRDRDDCLKAFITSQHIGWVMLLGIIL